MVPGFFMMSCREKNHACAVKNLLKSRCNVRLPLKPVFFCDGQNDINHNHQSLFHIAQGSSNTCQIQSGERQCCDICQLPW